MRYAINVETATSYDDDIGALEKSKAPVLVDYDLPSGENKCIGTIVSEQVNNIYIFIYNSNSNHRIYEYNDQYEVTELVIESSELNFTEYNNVVGDAVRGFKPNEILLYFTDNVNPIRQINVERAKDGGYGSIDQEKISLIKYQPNKAPTFRFTKDPSYNGNNIYNKVYQFRCRYICLDGEYSAYSYHSDLAFSEKQIKSDKFSQSYFDQLNDINNIKITVPTGSSIVEKIEVVYRLGNEGEWYTIKELSNDTSTNEITFDFKDDGAYPAANPDQTNKYFDNVPIKAEALKVVSNRLFLGNYVDGYDLNDTIKNADPSDISIKPFFEEVANFDFVDANSETKSVSQDQITVNVDFSNLSSFSKGNTLEFLGSGSVSMDTGEFVPVLNGNFTYDLSGGETLASAVAGLANAINGTTINARGVTVSYVSFVNATNDGIVVIITFDDGSGGIISADATNFDAGSTIGFTQAGSTFQYGSSYSLGIIEYDEALRASTVNTLPAGEVYIPSYGEVGPKRFDLKGRAFLDYRISPSIKPSPRTKYWSFAVTENKTKERSLTYSVTQAYVGSSQSPIDPNAIYLNMRGLVGKEDSYIESSGADLDTSFTTGDRVRVISYIDDNGDRVSPNGELDFKISEAQVYEGQDSPIYNSNDTIRTTGYLLKIEDTGIDRWDKESITSLNNSFWNQTAGSVIVEIYRPKSAVLEDDEVFYEIGGIQEVVNGEFAGNIRAAEEDKSYTLSAVGSNFYKVQGDVDFVIGDILVEKDGGSVNGFPFVTDIVSEAGFSYVYVNTTFTPFSATTIELADKYAAGRLKEGDAWYRFRRIRNDNKNGTAGNTASFITYPVIDSKVSDFIPYEAWSKGRPNAYSPLAQETERRSAITYSEPYFQDIDFNGLSSFNLANANFKAYPFDSGPIHRLWNFGNFLMVFQENDVARVPINNRIISTSDQQDSLTLSDKVINQERYYAAGYGLTNKDIFAAIDGRFYGYDIKRGKAWEINSQGHSLISEFKVQSHFDKDSKELVSFHNFIDMSVGIDKENDKALFGTKSKGADNIVSGTAGQSNSYVPGISQGGNNLFFKAKPQNGKAGNMTLATLQAPLSGYSYPLSNPATAPQSLNNVVRTGNILYGGTPKTSGSKNVQLNMPTGSGTNVTINGTVNLGNGQITIPTNQSSGNLSLASNNIQYEGFVLGYNYKANRWIAFYSFTPEHFTNINYSVFHFEDGKMYKLNTGNSYPTSPVASFETIFNQPRNSVKRFLTMGLSTSEDSDAETSAGWDAALSTNLNSTNLAENLFKKKEGVWRADLPRTTDISGTSAAIGLGIVSSKVGNKVFVSGLDTDSLGLNIGDLVSNGNDQSIGTITAIEKNNITLNTSSGVNQGDFIFAEKPSFIDGDQLRGYFMKVKLFAKSANQQEVYSVSALQQESNLHNL